MQHRSAVRTIEAFILEQERKHPEATGELTNLLYDIALGTKADVDKAVAAARRAFVTFSRTSRDERVAMLTRIADAYKKRLKEIGAAISDEMGAPISFSASPTTPAARPPSSG